MFDFNTFKQKSPQQRFLFILGLVFFVIYLGLGLYLIIYKENVFHIERKYSLLLGVVLIVYGMIRFIRLINQKDN